MSEINANNIILYGALLVQRLHEGHEPKISQQPTDWHKGNCKCNTFLFRYSACNQSNYFSIFSKWCEAKESDEAERRSIFTRLLCYFFFPTSGSIFCQIHAKLIVNADIAHIVCAIIICA